jgi:hypothetical protein
MIFMMRLNPVPQINSRVCKHASFATDGPDRSIGFNSLCGSRSVLTAFSNRKLSYSLYAEAVEP